MHLKIENKISLSQCYFLFLFTSFSKLYNYVNKTKPIKSVILYITKSGSSYNPQLNHFLYFPSYVRQVSNNMDRISL